MALQPQPALEFLLASQANDTPRLGLRKGYPLYLSVTGTETPEVKLSLTFKVVKPCSSRKPAISKAHPPPVFLAAEVSNLGSEKDPP